MISPVIIHVQNNAVANKQAAAKFWGELLKKDGKYLIEAKSIRRRSTSQNAYLHGVVIPMVYEGLKDAGFDDVRDHDDAKMIIKDLFLRRKIENKKTCTTIEVIRNTRDLTTVEMMDFIADVQKWSAEYLNIYIPDPGEQIKMQIA